MRRIIEFSYGILMTLVKDSKHFALFPDKNFRKLEPKEVLQVMNEASVLVDKLEEGGLIYSERQFQHLFL